MRLITNNDFTKGEFDKRLRFKTEPVERVTEETVELCLSMLRYMYRLDAVGLAANQVGLKLRICVIDPAWLLGKKMPIVLINPQIVEHGEELYDSPEGCLSLPDVTLHVPRFKDLLVHYIGLDGNKHSLEAKDGLFASIIQHELDHLDGYLFTDRVDLEEKKINYREV